MGFFFLVTSLFQDGVDYLIVGMLFFLAADMHDLKTCSWTITTREKK